MVYWLDSNGPIEPLSVQSPDPIHEGFEHQQVPWTGGINDMFPRTLRRSLESSIICTFRCVVRSNGSDGMSIEDGIGLGNSAWRDMVAQGLVVLDPSAREGVYVAGPGWQGGFDWVSFTPYIWNNSTGQFIIYEDPVSISYKREFSRNAGMQGMMIWEVDWDTADGELIQCLN